MKKVIYAVALMILLFSAQHSFGQFACFGYGGTKANPQNGCEILSTGFAGQVTINAFLDQFIWPIGSTVSGSVDGDLGQIQSGVTSVGCTPRGGDVISFVTKYAPGVHILKARFTRCGGYVQSWDTTLTLVLGPAPPSPDKPELCTPILIDPVASELLRGTAIETRKDILATVGMPVNGVAADGITQTVVRIPTDKVAETVTITVVDENHNPSGAPSENGGLQKVGSSGSPTITLTTESVNTKQGPMAFAFFRAPSNFSRGSQDNNAIKRNAALRVSCATSKKTTTTTTDVLIVRPPLFFVRGLWGAPGSWDTFGSSEFWSLAKDEKNGIAWRANYTQTVTGISETVPTFSTSTLAKVKRNALGFSYNAPAVLAQLRESLKDFRERFKVAAIQSDVVAHSMGGDISRTMSSLQDFTSDDTYQKGPIHKLVTIGTPHLGTPLASQLLMSSNQCVRDKLAAHELISLKTATISGTVVNGAVGDLDGEGVRGGWMSAALAALPPPSFPIAYIGTTTDKEHNLSGLECNNCTSSYLKLYCGNVKLNPLALNLTSEGWSNVFNGLSNDAVVPFISQVNGEISSSTAFAGVMHTTSLTELDFGRPAQLESPSHVPDKVATLLNESSDGSDFQHN